MAILSTEEVGLGSRSPGSPCGCILRVWGFRCRTQSLGRNGEGGGVHDKRGCRQPRYFPGAVTSDFLTRFLVSPLQVLSSSHRQGSRLKEFQWLSQGLVWTPGWNLTWTWPCPTSLCTQPQLPQSWTPFWEAVWAKNGSVLSVTAKEESPDCLGAQWPLISKQMHGSGTRSPASCRLWLAALGLG